MRVCDKGEVMLCYDMLGVRGHCVAEHTRTCYMPHAMSI